MATMAAQTITITPITQPDALYCQYPGQAQQQCILAIDLEDGELTCDYNPEIGGIPASVFNGRTLWYPIPCLTADAANTLMDEVKPLAERILAGAEIVWDGNNFVGRLDDDADYASQELAMRCAQDSNLWSDTDTVNPYDADDWFSGEGDEAAIQRIGLTADTTDAQLEALAEAEEQDATENGTGYTVLTGAKAWLLDAREDLRIAVRDELEQVRDQIEELLPRRDALIVRQVGWGDQDADSTRAIGQRAGLSHVQVQNIAKREARTAPRHTAQVGEANAAWLAENVGIADGNPAVFTDLGGGTVQVGDLDAAIGLGEDRDGVISRDENSGDLVLSIEGEGYPVDMQY